MSEKNFELILQEALPICEEAAAFIKSHFGKVRPDQVVEKDRNSLVSFVDEGAEKILVKGLSAIRPEAGFITEENTVIQEQKASMWIIDPLDGTSNFLYGVPHFAVSVALYAEGEVKVGIILSVMSGELFTAVKGKGAYLNGLPITVTKATSINDVLTATGFPYNNREHLDKTTFPSIHYFLIHTKGIRRFGSAALDLAFVACGRYGIYYEGWINAWDVAAGILLVQEAGGVVEAYKPEVEVLFAGSIVATTPALLGNVREGLGKNTMEHVRKNLL